MRRPALTAFVTALLAVTAPMALGAASAAAAGTPDGCTTDALHLAFANDPNSNDVFHIHRVGDQMQIGVVVSNNAAGACSYDDTSVTVRVPNADGTPGPITTVASHQSFPAGMAPTTLSTTVPYTIAFDAAVFHGPVTASATGVGHFPGGDLTQTTSLSAAVGVSKPHATLTVSSNVSNGPAPLAVTYTYTLKNDSPVDPAAPTDTPQLFSNTSPLNPDGSFLSDDTCTPISYFSGDTHVTSPAIIDPGETWTFTCPHTFTDFGSFTSHVAVVGFSGRDGRPWPVTTAQAPVVATAPDLIVTSAHGAGFTQGDHGRAYTLTVTNRGNSATTTGARVTDTLPAGLTATAIAGSGWDCTPATLHCTRADLLAAGAAYPAITVTTDVATNAAAALTNTATVSGGGEINTANDAASDVTAIAPPAAPAQPPVTTPTTSPVLATTIPVTATGPITRRAPNNRFVVGRVKIAKNGTATIRVTAPGPGVFALTGTAAKPVHTTARKAGALTLTLKPSVKAKRTLARAHRLTVRLAIAFTPTGGTPSTQHRTITLRLAAPKHHRHSS